MLKQFARDHAAQFTIYLFSGGLAFAVDYSTFWVLYNQADVYYVTASIAGSVLGFVTAFLGHKYMVFRAAHSFKKHLGRYLVVDIVSTTVATLLLYMVVELFGVPEEMAKVISMGSVVIWNFFLFKFIVYV